MHVYHVYDDYDYDIKDFKIRRLRTTGYGWTRVFRCLRYWTEYTTNGAKIQRKDRGLQTADYEQGAKANSTL